MSYNPRGNGQCERMNGNIWQTLKLMLAQKGLPLSKWEVVLPVALHAIRSLLCTTINDTPHNEIFAYRRNTATGTSLPAWLLDIGSMVLLKRHVLNLKYDPKVEPVKLVSANDKYATVKKSGIEFNTSLRNLAPYGRTDPSETPCPHIPDEDVGHEIDVTTPETLTENDKSEEEWVRRSERRTKQLDRLAIETTRSKTYDSVSRTNLS